MTSTTRNHRSRRSRRPPPFGDERRAAVRADGSVAETGPEPADDAEVGEGLPRRPGRHQAGCGTVRTSCGGRESRDGHERRGPSPIANAAVLTAAPRPASPAAAPTGHADAAAHRAPRRRGTGGGRPDSATPLPNADPAPVAVALEQRIGARRRPPPRPRVALRAPGAAAGTPSRTRRGARGRSGSRPVPSGWPVPIPSQSCDRRVVRVERRSGRRTCSGTSPPTGARRRSRQRHERTARITARAKNGNP